MEKSNFKVGFRVQEVSQWLDLDITLQMAFRRARGDFSRPESGTGIMDRPLSRMLTRAKIDVAER